MIQQQNRRHQDRAHSAQDGWAVPCDSILAASISPDLVLCYLFLLSSAFFRTTSLLYTAGEGNIFLLQTQSKKTGKEKESQMTEQTKHEKSLDEEQQSLTGESFCFSCLFPRTSVLLFFNSCQEKKEGKNSIQYSIAESRAGTSEERKKETIRLVSKAIRSKRGRRLGNRLYCCWQSSRKRSHSGSNRREKENDAAGI